MPRRAELRRSGFGMPGGMSVRQGGDVGRCRSGRLHAEVTPGGVTDLNSSRLMGLPMGTASGSSLRRATARRRVDRKSSLAAVLSEVPGASWAYAGFPRVSPATPTDARLGSPDGVGWSQARGHASRPGSCDLTAGFLLGVCTLKVVACGVPPVPRRVRLGSRLPSGRVRALGSRGQIPFFNPSFEGFTFLFGLALGCQRSARRLPRRVIGVSVPASDPGLWPGRDRGSLRRPQRAP